MNSSHYMDKRIMDLASSPILSSAASNDKDFIDLGTHQDADHGVTGTLTGIERDGGFFYDRHGGREDFVASYDFQPIRPTNSLPKTGSISGIRNYSSLDSFEPAKVIMEKDRHAVDTELLSEIDQTMKKHTDNILHALEGVSARLTQLETRARNLENSVDDLKISVESNHGNSDGKTRHLENILREVQTGVQAIKDRQEILETHFQMAKAYVSPPAPQIDALKSSHVESVQSSRPLPSQPFQQPPHGSPQQSIPVLSIPNALPPPPPSASQPNLPLASAQVPNQFPAPLVPQAPQREPYFPQPGHGQNQEASTQHQQYQLASAQLPRPPPAMPPPHHLYPPHSQPQHPPPAHTSQPHPSGPPMPSPQSQLGHHSEEAPYLPPQTFQPNTRQPPLQLPTGPHPTGQQQYGAAPQMYEPPPPRSSSGISSGYGLPSGPSEPSYSGGHQYGGGSPRKSQQHPQGGAMGSGYPQLPTARVLPQALPTASAVSGGSGSTGSGNRVPVDDVVDKVTSMGFSRDQVRATVRRLTENGEAVDLNIVLDKLMNDSDVQPPRGWFGR